MRSLSRYLLGDMTVGLALKYFFLPYIFVSPIVYIMVKSQITDPTLGHLPSQFSSSESPLIFLLDGVGHMVIPTPISFINDMVSRL